MKRESSSRPTSSRIARRRSPRRLAKRGFILVAARMCLFVISLISASATRSMVQQVRQAKKREHRYQAYWIAVGALDRAAARIERSRDYRGETWTIDAAEIGGVENAVAEIVVRPIDETPDQFTLTVRAAYPDDEIHRVTVEKNKTIRLAPTGDGS